MKLTKSLVLLGIVTAFIYSSCTYKFNDLEADGGIPNVNNSVTFSFKDTVQPIFNLKCIGCHKAGTTAGDKIILTSDVSYQQLMSKTGMVDTANPELSKIYLYPKAGTATHSQMKYNNAQANLVFSWISQGAKNN